MTDSPFPPPPNVPTTGLSGQVLTRAFLVQLAVGGVVGALLAVFGIHFGKSLQIPKPGLAFLLSLPFVYFATVLVHEIGHAIGGKLAGMRLFALYAGPLHFDFSAGPLRVRRNRVVAPWGGLALCLPRKDATRGEYSALLAGGPAANFVLAGAAVLVAQASGGTVASVAWATAAFSAFTGFVNLMPFRVGGQATDGSQLIGMLRGGDETRRNMALGQLVAQSCAGTRARDLDLALLGDAKSGDARFDAAAALFRAAAARDRGDRDATHAAYVALAETLRADAASGMPLPSRRAFSVSVATWLGHERDAAGARAWLDFTRGGLVDPTTLAHAEAAVAFAEGRADDARRHVAAVRAALPGYADQGGATSIAEQLDDLERALGTA